MAEILKSYRAFSGVLGGMLILSALSSCSNAAPSADVLAGNLSYGRGQYQKAILQYLHAGDTAAVGRDVIYYDLANVYFALGEGDAALRSWGLAEENTDNVDILFRVAFNRGVLYYLRGHYDEAYRAFKRALKLRPGDVDAKINLEESLSRVRSTATRSRESEGAAAENGPEDRQRLLDYVRRKEAGAWKSKETLGEPDAADW
ncbi:MAG: hypothetical protein CSA76_01125 [Spirochaetales bacterium]|nr:MAG: hypothetical protein CSA76_01125 [Spirochaetales bacterium]